MFYQYYYIFGIVSLVDGATIVHPAQVLLDYILPCMALGLSGILGTDSKGKVLMGCIIAVVLNVVCHTLAGYIFFAQYAPENMNPLIYSLVYNVTGSGVEGLLSAIVLTILPVTHLKKLAKA